MKELNNIITDGLVNIKDYNRLIESQDFKEIELFSNDFIDRVGATVKSFDKKWIADLLHQWSRQWEYPYIINQADSFNRNARVVDLGAGMSFLTHYLEDRLGFKDIIAVDYDKTLDDLYKRVNVELDSKVKFEQGDMRNLINFKSNSVDFVYSVSAIEHTDEYLKILEEIHRILKKGGKFSFTFDISIDGLDDITLSRAEYLVESLNKIFNVNIDSDFESLINNNINNLITTPYIASIDKRLTPWKYPIINIIRPMVKCKKVGKLYKNLTFCCLTVTKR